MERAQLLGVLRAETEEVAGTLDVAVEDIESDEEVQQLAGDGRAEFGEPLGSDDRREPAFAAARAQVCECGDAEPAGLGVLGAACEMGCKEVAFVDARTPATC